jgi:hypothetical protein
VVKRATWLSITPEPERELPEAVATLTAGHRPPADAIEAERMRIERLILHGSQREWLDYLSRVVSLIESRLEDPDPAVLDARERAVAVVSNHHNLLLAVPGSGGRRAAADRDRLSHLLR